jgi:hypothetical protein
MHRAPRAVAHTPATRAAPRAALRRRPARYAPLFGKRRYQPELEREASSFEEQVEAMSQLIKVRTGPGLAVLLGPGSGGWGRARAGCVLREVEQGQGSR